MTEKRSVLILGHKGMLGQELISVFSADENYDVTGWDIEDIDVLNVDELKEKINALWPDIIMNAVAYNAVDLCEEDGKEHDKAIALNTTYPENLAKIARELQATLVHYSTDYVFDGERPHFKGGGKNPRCCGQKCDGCMYMGDLKTLDYFSYHENDEPLPLSHYGQTKYDGEEVVAKNCSAHYVIRLSKLFGKPATSSVAKKSFFDVMLELGKKNDSVQAVDGETSKFTYAPDLAQESKNIIDEHTDFGVYHIVNEGAVTWYDGVKVLYKIAGITTTVEPVPPETFPRPAKRPSSSVLKVTKREPLRHYEKALEEYLNL